MDSAMSKADIPFLKPHLPELEKYEACLREVEARRVYSNFGPVNARFEAGLLETFFGGAGAITTVNNATIALMVALKLHGRTGRRYVIMPSYTFAATPLAAMWAGFMPYFVDIEAGSWAADPAAITAAIDTLKDDVAAVVPYATFGNSIDLDYYAGLERSGIPVVVDAASSLGCRDGALNFGAGFPGIVIYSLHATKSFPVGEGGLLYSARPDLVSTMRQMLNFGFDATRSAILPGLNGKLPEILACIGLATLEDFPAVTAQRRAVTEHYGRMIMESGLLAKGWQVQDARGDVVRQFFPMLTPPGISGLDVAQFLAERGVQVRNYFDPACHQQPAFVECPHADLDYTEAIATRSISLPLWNELPLDAVDRIVALLDEATGRG